MRAIAIDAELLVLLIVGAASPEFIEKHRRLNAYTAADFQLLGSIIGPADQVLVTPNALTEASNLLGYVSEPIRTLLYATFREMVAGLEERYVQSSHAATREEFLRLGLADSAMLEAVKGGAILLTADLDLYLAAISGGREAINFVHAREAAGLIP